MPFLVTMGERLSFWVGEQLGRLRNDWPGVFWASIFAALWIFATVAAHSGWLWAGQNRVHPMTWDGALGYGFFLACVGTAVVAFIESRSYR